MDMELMCSVLKIKGASYPANLSLTFILVQSSGKPAPMVLHQLSPQLQSVNKVAEESGHISSFPTYYTDAPTWSSSYVTEVCALFLAPCNEATKTHDNNKNRSLDVLHFKYKWTHSLCPVSALFPDISEPKDKPVGDCLPVTPDEDTLEANDNP